MGAEDQRPPYAPQGIATGLRPLLGLPYLRAHGAGGPDVRGFLRFSVRRQSMVAAVVLIRAGREHIGSVAREVAGIDGVAEVYSVSGDWDLVAIVRVPEWERIADVVSEHLAALPGIERTYTLVAFRVYSRQDLASAFDMFE
jgi:DNA-binding Lrp family transcriptional regulator